MKKKLLSIPGFYIATGLTIASCSFLTIMFSEGYYFGLYLISCGLMSWYSLETAIYAEEQSKKK